MPWYLTAWKSRGVGAPGLDAPLLRVRDRRQVHPSGALLYGPPPLLSLIVMMQHGPYLEGNHLLTNTRAVVLTCVVGF